MEESIAGRLGGAEIFLTGALNFLIDAATAAKGAADPVSQREIDMLIAGVSDAIQKIKLERSIAAAKERK